MGRKKKKKPCDSVNIEQYLGNRTAIHCDRKEGHFGPHESKYGYEWGGEICDSQIDGIFSFGKITFQCDRYKGHDGLHNKTMDFKWRDNEESTLRE